MGGSSVSPADIESIKTQLNTYASKTDVTDLKTSLSQVPTSTDVAQNYLTKLDYTTQAGTYAKADQLKDFIKQTDLDTKFTGYLKTDSVTLKDTLSPTTMWCAAGGEFCEVPTTKNAKFPLDVSVGRNFSSNGAGTFNNLEATGTTKVKDIAVTGTLLAPNYYPIVSVTGNNGSVTCSRFCNGDWGKGQLSQKYPEFKGARSTLANGDAHKNTVCECQMSNTWAWNTLP